MSSGHGHTNQGERGEQPGGIRRPGGEFQSPELERAFRADHQAENRRHANTLLIASTILNGLFLAGDWQFHGGPDFAVTMMARAAVIVVALVALLLLRRARSAGAMDRILIGWMAANAATVAALVTSHYDTAMFVMLMLPIIYYLAVPVSFAARAVGGAGCSMLMVAGYHASADRMLPAPGLGAAMLVLNVAMILVVSRSNRLERLEWRAVRAARETSAQLAASREQIEKMFAASPVPMIVTARSTGRLIQISDSAVEFFGAGAASVGVTSAIDFYADPRDRDRLVGLIDRDGHVRNLEMRVRLADSSLRTVLVNATAVDLADGRIIMSGIIDISERKAVEQDLERIASTDLLTGLLNRLSFLGRGRTEMLLAGHRGTPLALLMVDLDNFKQINDGFGHQSGDEALRSFASTCRTVLGEHGIAARLGGEEFGIILPGADLAEAHRVAESLRETVDRMPIVVSRGLIRLTASIGVALVDPRDADLDPALGRADAALYAAKHNGRNCVVVHDMDLIRRAG